MYHSLYKRANVFIFVLYLYALFNLYILSNKKQTVYDIFPRNQCYLYPSGVPDPVTYTDVPVLVLPTIDSLLTKLDFLPQAVPADLADKLERFHGDPAVWWIGQVVSYLIRPNSDLRLYLTESEQNVTRQGPIVG